MAVCHYIEHQTGWSIKRFVRTTRRYRTVKIKARRQTLTAVDPLADDLSDALAKTGSARRPPAQLGVWHLTGKPKRPPSSAFNDCSCT